MYSGSLLDVVGTFVRANEELITAREDAIGWLESEVTYLRAAKREMHDTLSHLAQQNDDHGSTSMDLPPSELYEVRARAGPTTICAHCPSNRHRLWGPVRRPTRPNWRACLCSCSARTLALTNSAASKPRCASRMRAPRAGVGRRRRPQRLQRSGPRWRLGPSAGLCARPTAPARLHAALATSDAMYTTCTPLT